MCERCKGHGFVENTRLLHSGAGEKCPACDGTGLGPATKKQFDICESAAAKLGPQIMKDWAKILRPDFITDQPISTEVILDEVPRDLPQCMVIGFDKDGELYVAATDASLPECNYLLDKAKQYILEYEK